MTLFCSANTPKQLLDAANAMAGVKEEWIKRLLRSWVSELEPSVVYTDVSSDINQFREVIHGLTAEGHNALYVYGRKEFILEFVPPQNSAIKKEAAE